jgi:hypothetical protein
MITKIVPKMNILKKLFKYKAQGLVHDKIVIVSGAKWGLLKHLENRFIGIKRVIDNCQITFKDIEECNFEEYNNFPKPLHKPFSKDSWKLNR